MQSSRIFGMMMAAAALASAACGDQGGELKDVTARRRAEQLAADSANDSAAARPPADTGYQIPAFADQDTAARTAPAAAPADTAAKPATPAAPPPAEWTSATREVGRPGVAATLRGLRTAANAGYDRVVLDFGAGAVPGWQVEYVDTPVRRCGSGEPVEIAGDGRLRIRLRTAQAHDDAGQPTVRQREQSLSMPNLRELEMTCDFEGDVEIVLGVSSPKPYRVMELSSPSRLVVDVQQ